MPPPAVPYVDALPRARPGWPHLYQASQRRLLKAGCTAEQFRDGIALRRSGSASDEADGRFGHGTCPLAPGSLALPGGGSQQLCCGGPTMRRVVLLFLPSWATNRLRRRNGGLSEPEVPLITAMQDGDQRLIASVDEAARRLKLRPRRDDRARPVAGARTAYP